MRDASEFLLTCSWFEGAPAEAMAALAERTEWRSYEVGEYLYRRNEQPAGVFGVLEGSFKIAVSNEAGFDAVTAVMPAGDWFGEIFLFGDRPYYADCTAMERSRVLFLSRADLLAFCEHWPLVYRNLVWDLGRKSLQVIWMAVQYKLVGPEMRLAQRLDLTRQRTPGPVVGEWVTLREKFSHELIAQILGLSRPRVTLAIKALTEAGVLIANRGRIQVHVARLKAYCSSDEGVLRRGSSGT